jgi:asparagine synthase (glutamine-hydrolysing)
MCGIAGIISRSNHPGRPAELADTAARMSATLVHRGPDDSGVWVSEDGLAALSHRRLSIIDLSELGRNPMSWDSGRLWITFNGEIYNFGELRAELERAGCRFRTRTDTEVILAAYDVWGLDSVTRLVGMFAFALWDGPKRRLWLVRDRLGKKPIYYADNGEWLRFGSELKCLFNTGTEPRTIDPGAVDQYLRYGYIPSPRTIFKGVNKLPPAHFLLCEAGRLTVERYWDPVKCAGRRTTTSVEEAEADLENRLGTAVRQRLIADVPLGAFLSGGIDSSLIVALMREQSASKVRTFTIRFDNPEFNEADQAASVARHLQTDHHEQRCDDKSMREVVGQLPAMFDEPFADSSAIPTYLVSKAARAHVTVALSGDGGDELFFGYPRYAYHATARWALKLPRPVRRAAALAAQSLPTRRLRRIGDVLGNDDADHYARFISWCTPRDVRRMTGSDPETAAAYQDVLNRIDHLDWRDRPAMLDLVSYLPEDILTKVDRASMAVGLEVRAPLLDHRVVEYAVGLPIALKWHRGTTKWILRRLLYKRVPPALIERPKMGFGVPLKDWFQGPLREQMDDYCAGSDLEVLGLNPQMPREMWMRFKAGQPARVDLLWQIFMLAAWARSWKQRC